MSASGRYASAAYFDAEKYKTSGKTDLQAIQAACSAATTFSSASVVRLSSRVWDVGNGLSMSGYSCGLIGLGAGFNAAAGGTPSGTVLKASTQSGAVLSLVGWTPPDQMRGRVEFGNFSLQGSGVADATKANIGLAVSSPTTANYSLWMHDISISGTGGPCIDVGVTYLSSFDRLTLITPVSAKDNDVPYFIGRGCNGCTFNGLGFRSMAASADTGVSGALVLTADGNGSPSAVVVFNETWFENLHVPTGGALISSTGNAVSFNDVMLYDCFKETGATGTAVARFLPPASSDYGGSMWRGGIPGKGTAATSLDVGLDIQQSGNAAVGRKGYSGNNVQIAAGVDRTTIIFTGSENATTNPGVINNSTARNNVILDYPLGTLTYGAMYATQGRSSGDGGAGPLHFDPATPANGAVWMGNGGSRIQTVGATMYANSDTFTFRNQASTAGRAISVTLGAPGGTSSPGMVFPDAGALPAAASYLRGKMCIVYGNGTTTADQMWMCRMTATGTYAWVQVTT